MGSDARYRGEQATYDAVEALVERLAGERMTYTITA
jgi:hypothetical protein